MIREYLEEVANVGETLWSRNGADLMSIYRDGDSLWTRKDFLNVRQNVIATSETNTYGS